MAVRITKENLDQIIKINKEIDEDIRGCVAEIGKRYNKANILSPEKLALNILKTYNLIQIPIDDEYLGGKVEVRNNKKIPIINTAQPRVYQYFVAWHEVYHILFDENLNTEQIYREMNVVDVPLIERKADYFAACMLLGNVFEYYIELEGDFIDKIMKCIDMYKAPYKAILVKLYECADRYQNQELKTLCLKYIDKKPVNLIEKFNELELDSELVRPSNLVNLGHIDSLIEEQVKANPQVTYHENNRKYLEGLKKSITKDF
ncbi:ImmA/IrrE family metallo-endopeptidase [Tepidibacter sp. Z1-5]|uniref:ImmA/IrrE family metallo-endopeptidase n=1 Tax=Tepidibacter sp. Z1-5 TaxID=3134138 RepID=UPI0030C0454F